MFELQINFLKNSFLNGRSIWSEPAIRDELRAIAFSTLTDREKAAKAVAAVYTFFGYKTPEIQYVSSPHAAIELLTQKYPPTEIPNLPDSTFLKEWKKILKKQLNPSLIDQLNSTEIDEVLDQLVQQMLLDNLKGELNKLLIITCDRLGKYLDFPIESAIGSSLKIELKNEYLYPETRRLKLQTPADPTIDLQNQLPSVITLSSSPASLKSQLRIALGEDLDIHIWDKIWQKIATSMKITTRYPIIPVRPEAWLYKYACWLAVYNSLNESESYFWQIFQAFIQDCGWIFPFEKVCIICDRPINVSFDDSGNIHAEGTPAIKFADGYNIYASHGVISLQQVETPSIQTYQPITLPETQSQTPWLLAEENTEIKRTLIQALSSKNGCQELRGTILDVWQEYELLSIKTNHDSEATHLLKITSPTGQTQVFRVPFNIQSAQQAKEWINWDRDSKDSITQTLPYSTLAIAQLINL